jgi:hypothetical protein
MLGKGYDPGVVRDVVRRLQRRRPDIEWLAYFDAGLADRHSKRAETPAARAMAGAGVDWDAAIGVYAAVIFWSRCAGPARLELLAKHGTDAATDAAIRKPG